MRVVSDHGMRLLLVDDFGLEPGTRAKLDGTIDGLLSEVTPQLAGTVGDRLDIRERRDLSLRIPIASLDDFAPSALLAKIDAAGPWLEARQALPDAPADSSARQVLAVLPEALRDDAFGRGLSTAGQDSGPLQGLLSKVDIEAAPRQRAIDEIDRRLARQAVALVQCPWLRRIEAAWRSLDLLARQCQALPAASLEIYSAPQDTVAELFFQDVFHQEYDGEEGTPLGAVMLGYGFDRGQPALECLETCARMGESLRVPFLGSLSAAFWGIKRQALLAGLPDLVGRLQGPEYVKWNRFRDDELSLWMALVVNRFLLRRGWRDEGVEGLPWRPGDKEDQPLWGHGAWLLAFALLRAHADGGLRMPLTQVELRGLTAGDDGKILEVPLNEQRVMELGHCGLVPLVAAKGADAVRIPLAPTFHRPRRFDRDDATRASFFAATLAHQSFASLASHRLQKIAEDLELGLDDEQLMASFRSQMLAFLGAPEEAPEPQEGAQDADPEAIDEVVDEVVTVQVEAPPERPETRLVTVRIRPPFEVCGGRADLVLGTVVLVGSP